MPSFYISEGWAIVPSLKIDRPFFMVSACLESVSWLPALGGTGVAVVFFIFFGDKLLFDPAPLVDLEDFCGLLLAL